MRRDGARVMSSPNKPEAETPPSSAASPNPAADRPSHRPWTLRSVLTASHVGLLAAVVAAFAGTIYWMMSRAVHHQAEADLLAAAEILVRELNEGTAPTSLRIPETYFHRFGPAPRDQAFFALWNSAGVKVVDKGNVPAGIGPLDRRPKREGPHPFETQVSGLRLDIVVATPDGGQLRIGRPLAKESDDLGRLAVRLATGAMVALVIGAIAAVWLADRISTPLRRMAVSAQRVSDRNLKERLPAESTIVEAGQLATVFNAMLLRLEQAFDRQSRFTADASHELRTPVAVILAQAEHALSRERASEDYQGALGTCRDAARRMKRLVDDLLLLSRADGGQLLARRDPLDLAQITRDVVDLLRPLAQERKVQVNTKLVPSRSLGDAGQLGQVVTNLLTNAIRYNHQGGEVLVSVEPRQCEDSSVKVALTVEDRGPGIPLASQATVFDRFTRGDSARTQHGETGTGLGLSIVREIVEAHGGTVALQSTPGNGTTMTVLLPTSAMT